MSCRSLLFAAALSAFLAVTSAIAADRDYQSEVTVSGETRLDWIFAVSNQSRPAPPEDWLRGYESKQQRYELYVPPQPKDSKRGHPMILFISAGNEPAGWNQLASLCKQKGILFASPYGAGNGTPTPRRARIVLDVLDDVRRNHAIDADRTYLAGFSGGGRVACAIAFALPELFGGVIPVCAGGELREEPWLRHRLIERLSVAFVTGPNDFNLGEISRFRGPMFADMGIRTKVTVVPKLGHGIPDARGFSPVLEWLDAGTVDRRRLAQDYPASRIESNRAPTREEWANSLLKEGQTRVKDRKSLFSGLMQLQGVMTRWPDLPAAEEAKAILLEHENQAERPWESDDVAEQRKFLVARARALDAYASGDLPEQYLKQRGGMAQAAMQLWQMVIQDGQDSKAIAEAKRRIPKLKELVGDAEEK